MARHRGFSFPGRKAGPEGSQPGPRDLPGGGALQNAVAADKVEIPMDFEPDEAREIAEEILAAAKAAEVRR